jgi:hypothetical protein
VTDVNPIDELAARILLEHHRESIKGCSCGWGQAPSELGKRHSVHVVSKLREAGVLKEVQ